jgi:cell division septum initiation protein DivIVA
MAKRLIRLRELGDIEGLVEHHRKVQERIEALEANAAQFDTPVQGTLELSRKADDLKRELVALLEKIPVRVRD